MAKFLNEYVLLQYKIVFMGAFYRSHSFPCQSLLLSTTYLWYHDPLHKTLHTCTYHNYILMDIIWILYQVYGWGNNGCGELGIGSTTNQPSPKPITTLDNKVITKVMN